MSDQNWVTRFRKGLHPREAGRPAFGYSVEERDGLIIERDVAIPLRDGKKVYADIFRPAGNSSAPAFVGYAPFGKHPHIDLATTFKGSEIPVDEIAKETPFECLDPIRWARDGYALVYVDGVGNWWSEGEAIFFGREEAEVGYDIVEWCAAQDWCTGKVGWGGVSYYGMTAWSVAALRPPHLAAILPWEASSDVYREAITKGGIPSRPLTHNWMLLTRISLTQVEDHEAMASEHPMFDAYWRSKVCDWRAIEAPTYAVTGWPNDLHLRGTLEAWKAISSLHKYLDIHGGKEWKEFYSPWAVERQRAFLGHFLKDEQTAVLGWSPVRVGLRTGGKEWTFREEPAWPLARTEYRELYLDAENGALVTERPEKAATVAYLSTDDADQATFDFKVSEPLEITGNSKLRVWLSCPSLNDADVFVGLEKLDKAGQPVRFIFSQMFDDGPCGFGWLRASHRELDEARSTPERPWHKHERQQWLTHGEPVALDIEIWPTSVSFEPGETLRLVVKGDRVVKHPDAIMEVRYAPLQNFGRHVLHAGGEFDSHLLAPVIPRS
jgi:uncharacterized protein